MRKMILAALLVFTSELCMAQSDLVFSDADGDRMGTLVQVFSPELEWIQLLTEDGYLINFDPKDGTVILNGNNQPTEYWFKSKDCTGQPYIDADMDAVRWMRERGGQVFQVGYKGGGPVDKHKSPGFARVDWGQSSESINADSSLDPWLDVCVPADSVVVIHLGLLVTPVDPADYGISKGDSDLYGFAMPISTSVETAQNSDAIFCDGLESCPYPAKE